MYAVIETGGKQYRVQKGDVLRVERLAVSAGETVTFDKVLVLKDASGLKVGTPYVEGAAVEAVALSNGKADKVVIFKYKNKKDYRKKQGHRQPFTEVEIKSLGGEEDEPAAVEEAPAAEEAVEEVQEAAEETVAEAPAEEN